MLEELHTCRHSNITKLQILNRIEAYENIFRNKLLFFRVQHTSKLIARHHPFAITSMFNLTALESIKCIKSLSTLGVHFLYLNFLNVLVVGQDDFYLTFYISFLSNYTVPTVIRR